MAVPTPDTYGDLIRSDVPVLWHRFDSVALLTDSATTPANATAPVAAPTASPSLLGDRTANQAANFNGTNQYIVSPDVAKTRLANNFTVEVWLSVDAFATGAFPAGVQYIIDKAMGQGGWGLSLWSGEPVWFAAQPTAGFVNAFVGWILQPGKVYHLAMTYENRHLKAYVNGQLAAHQRGTEDLTTTGGTMTVGTRWSSGAAAAPYFDGRFDELAVYNRVLGADEILEHYLVGVDNLALTLANEPYSRAVLRDNPNSLLRFVNAGVLDVQSDQIGGTLTNGAVVASPSIIPAAPNLQALVLDGVNDYLSIPAHLKWEPPANFTIEAWVNLDVITGTRTIIQRTGDYALKVVNGLLTWQLFTDTGSFTLTAGAGFTMVPGQTYHVVATYRQDGFWGSGIYLYQDAFEVAPGVSITGNRVQNASVTYVGATTGTSEFFDGKIADVSIYPFALSSRRVREHTFKGVDAYTLGMRPAHENFDFEQVGLRWPPEWQTMPFAHWITAPNYFITWDGHGGINIGGPYGQAHMIHKNEGIAPQRDMDINYVCGPPTNIGAEHWIMTYLCHDGVVDTVDPWRPRNGYVLWLYRTSTALTGQIRKYVNGAQSDLTAAISLPVTAWSATGATLTRVRFQVRNKLVRFRVWKEGDFEPGQWQGSVLDTGVELQGYAGVGHVNANDNVGRGTWFDEIQMFLGSDLQHFAVRGGAEVPLDMYAVSNSMERLIQTNAPTDLLVSDNFDRANAAVLGSANTGQPWTASSGTWSIVNNEAQVTSTAGAIATVDAGEENFDIELIMRALVDNPPIVGISFNYIDGGNRMTFYMDGTNLILAKNDASVLTQFVTVGGQSWLTGTKKTLRLVQKGNKLFGYLNGVLSASYIMNIREMNKFGSLRNAGLRYGSVTASQVAFENFTVKRVAP